MSEWARVISVVKLVQCTIVSYKPSMFIWITVRLVSSIVEQVAGRKVGETDT